MGISTADIKELRERTSAGILDCKKALNESDGDMDKAVDYLREKGIASAEKRSDRTASEGLVAVKESGDYAAIVEINSETDFVAKNDKFKTIVDKLIDHVLENKPADTKEVLEQEFADSGNTVEKFLKESIAEIGENISFRRFAFLEKDEEETFGVYLHMGGSIGVILKITGGDNQLAKDLAMHIAAINPDYLDRDSVPEADVAKEKEMLEKQAAEEDKPEHIIEKIVEGRLNKFYNQNCLLEQEYVKDSDIKVSDLLDDKDAEIVDFIRYEVGEGIEVEKEDFAKEVENEINN